jgi:OmpA family
MSNTDNHSPLDGGIIGVHRSAEPFAIRVGPATKSEFNTARLKLLPLACWRVDDMRFKFDSSFVLPGIEAEIKHLATMLGSEQFKDCPISIFGHADPVGNDDYNKTLSGRRAAAIYGLLVRDPSIWENLFSSKFGNDIWGDDAIATMNSRLAEDDASKASKLQFGSGKIDDGDSGGGSAAASSSQDQSQPNSSPIDGAAKDAGRRKQLFTGYMDKICGDFKVDRSTFLGQGADKGGKADFQGCSEFNPLLIFSQDKQDLFQTAAQQKDTVTLAERDKENAKNRRVMVLIFRKGSKVDPARWPCPRWNEGVAGCKKRFFSDGEKRRSDRLPDTDRKFDQTRDTFACRFYQRLSDSSPCEQVSGLDFRYALEKREDLPWSDQAKLRIASEDGTQQRVFAMGEGQLIDDLLVFTFRHCRAGVSYKGEIQDGSIVVQLFPPTELFRIMNPDDPLNVVPLNLPNQFAGDPPRDGGGVTPDPADKTILVDTGDGQ